MEKILKEKGGIWKEKCDKKVELREKKTRKKREITERKMVEFRVKNGGNKKVKYGK